NAARAVAELADAIERAGIVAAVDAGRDDDDALEAERSLQRTQIVDRRRGRRVDALGREGKFRRIAEDVHVTVAGAARHVEIDRRPDRRRRPALHGSPPPSAKSSRHVAWAA